MLWVAIFLICHFISPLLVFSVIGGLLQSCLGLIWAFKRAAAGSCDEAVASGRLYVQSVVSFQQY
jgi:hypothetical protein